MYVIQLRYGKTRLIEIFFTVYAIMEMCFLHDMHIFVLEKFRIRCFFNSGAQQKSSLQMRSV